MTRTRTRRAMLAEVGTLAGLGVLSQPVSAQSNGTSEANRRTIRAVIPAQQPFAGNYTGQILLFNHLEDESVNQSGIGDCEFASWSPDDTNRYVGLLADRLGDAPRSVHVDIYTNGSREDTIQVGSVGIVNRVHSCPGGLVGLEIEQFDPSAIRRLGARDATTTPEATTTGQGPGFGLAAGAVGLAGAALARFVRGREE